MKRLAAVVFSLALLVWLSLDERWREVLSLFATLELHVAAIVLTGLAFSYLLRAMRVYDEFRHGGDGRFIACLRIVLIHNALVNVVPFRGGEVAFPVLLNRTFGTPVPRAVASLLWFRLQDAFIVAIAACIIWPGIPLWLRLIGIASLMVVAWYLPRWAALNNTLLPTHRWRQHVVKLRAAFATSARHARFSWLWTISNWSVKLSVQAWLLATLLSTEWAIGATGALGAELASILPVQGVAGFGTYEAAAAGAVAAQGVSFSHGLQAALVLHVVVITSALALGALAWLALPSRNEPTP